MSDELLRNGFAMVAGLAAPNRIAKLAGALDTENRAAVSTNRHGAKYAARNLLQNQQVLEFCHSTEVVGLLTPLMDRPPQPVRAILFDKVENANWRVGWHQDVMIPVRKRIETPNFTAWSVKAGVPHVKPPAGVLERMISLRLHLDDCGEDNGPLEVLPGSHRNGHLSSEQVKRHIQTQPPTRCVANRGDALLMRPLLLHASAKAVSPNHRRVLHIEFASDPLPDDLTWPQLP